MARLSIFPLAGALLFPRALLPLHIFEPRYRAMISDAMARDRRIGMIQPRDETAKKPALFEVGCVGRIAEFEALEDGRYNLVLEGLTRFRLVSELDVTTAFRQIEADVSDFVRDGDDPDPLGIALRADLEREARRYADAKGYAIDWEAVERLDDEGLVNGVAQVAPFDIATKQALLEAPDMATRADLVVQFLRFFRHDDSDEDDDGATLQ
ncbi:LON peptidase substrate-binding domain-containing protein [Sphingomonas abietis]|uniref:LON peptidase substrate-binding domain-containing protein n=1 Tax=Sphingomonas abietis TaxID=3012344 RepID=A0ABY7NM29_9SPHN|nr:LON peptidase substrate-binding domain-containing protein [Sphingomonas abietis]WBO22564.1 LON peptidase substrate-binding domain-containing protein [Sphingomonas abietis]